MNANMITVLINEKRSPIPAGLTVGDLREQIKPDADLLVINGFPATADTTLEEGDRVVFIRRGEIPRADELETLMVARHTPGVHERMKRATVGIAGLGGLGSTVAIALARMHIGTLILVDFDLVEPSNLNRQQYSIEHIGMAKTDAMTRILSNINPYVRVDTHQVVVDKKNVCEIFQRADIIVECFDKAEAKAVLIQAVAEFLPERYVIGASGVAGYGDSNSIQTRKLGQRIFLVGDLAKAAQPGQGLMAPRVGIAAHHQANLVINLLMDGEDLAL
jgi:sulfur carrier protein ThiS adenylyltransferase